MEASNTSNLSVDLLRKLAIWDKQLETICVPTYDSLIDYLCRRIVSSQCWVLVRHIVEYFLRWLLYFLGFEDAHKRIEQDQARDAATKCWYCPQMFDDRFGIRPGETILDGSSLPSQVQLSYAMVIRGISPSTTILDGLGEDLNTNNRTDNNNTIYQGGYQNDSPMIHRATSLILSILKARDFYMGSKFNPDKYKEKPLTMQWYGYLFGTSLQFHRELIERYTTSSEYSRHIIVIYQGRLYKVPLIRRDIMDEDVMPTFEEIKRQLERVLQASPDQSNWCVNPITTLTAKERYLLEQSLREASNRNRYNFGTIRDCLFVVSLDSEDSPRMANDSLYLLHSKNATNRWYDQSVNLVVFKNGVAGFVMNYLCGMTGTVASSFVELVKNLEEEILQTFQEKHSSRHDQIKLKELATPSLLTWDDTIDSVISKKITLVSSLSHENCPFTPLHPAMFKLNCELTRKDLISLGVSPSGTFNAAFQLALVRMCKRQRSVFEIISLRHAKFGGLAWMETNTADMKLFVNTALKYLSTPDPDAKNVLRTLLLRGIASYREDVLRHKRGEVNLWHLDAIYRTLGLQTRLPYQRGEPRNLRSLFEQPIIDYLRSPGNNNTILPPRTGETVISNPSWHPALEAVGRVGVKGLLPLGVHYLFSRTSIAVSISSSKSHPCHGKHKEFAKELEKSYRFISELLEEKKES